MLRRKHWKVVAETRDKLSKEGYLISSEVQVSSKLTIVRAVNSGFQNYGVKFTVYINIINIEGSWTLLL